MILNLFMSNIYPRASTFLWWPCTVHHLRPLEVSSSISLRCDLVVVNPCTLWWIHRKFMPLSVVLNVLSPSIYSIKPYSIKSRTYSLVSPWERYTSYIILVNRTRSPLALSNICAMISFLSLYFISILIHY
jgi:hypothetical protein